VGVSEPLAEFLVSNEPGIASSWSFDAAAGRIAQSSAAALGSLDLSEPQKVGPELLFRPGGQPFRPARFIVSIEFDSASQDGVGLVFGRAGAADAFYFLASARHQYRVFGRKASNVFSFVGAPATGLPLAQNVRHELTLTVYDRTLIAELDGTRELAVEAPAELPAGGIGFLTHGNGQARFYRARVIELV
jgi:hypothetical protein